MNIFYCLSSGYEYILLLDLPYPTPVPHKFKTSSVFLLLFKTKVGLLYIKWLTDLKVGLCKEAVLEKKRGWLPVVGGGWARLKKKKYEFSDSRITVSVCLKYSVLG